MKNSVNCQEYLRNKTTCSQARFRIKESRRFRDLESEPNNNLSLALNIFCKEDDDIVQRNARTGTSFFRLELPMYAIKRNFPDEFNIVYADNNIGPNHVAIADMIMFHRAGHLHDYLHKIFKVWPKTKKRPLVFCDVDDNE
jgi:hypothetical protein